jgi:NADH dehydrogenase
VSEQLVLVTGAAGKLGAIICEALQANGWRVRALRHRRTPPVYDELAEGSLDKIADLSAALKGVDAVLHLAAVTHARRAAMYQEVNVRGTSNLVEAARAADVARFVFVSTRAISPDGGAYSRSKSEAERIVSTSGLPYVIVRLPEVYGVGGAEGVDNVIERARANRLIPLVAAGAAQVCPAHVDDVVQPLVRALENREALDKTYTLAGECMTLGAFGRACIEAFGSTSSVVALPTPGVRALASLSRFLPLPIYPDQLSRLLAAKPAVSVDAAKDLGFAARPLLQGLMSLHMTSDSPAG